MYVKPKDASKHYNVSTSTLRRWSLMGQIKYIKLKSGHRRYLIENKKINQINQNQSVEIKNSSKKMKIKNENEKNENKKKLSKILQSELILNENKSKQYWKVFSKETSKKLWFPIETELQDSDTHYLNGFVNNTIQSSYVITKKKQITQKIQKNSLKTSCLSSQFSQKSTMEEENTKIKLQQSKIIQYCRKIRFYPTKQFKLLAEKCFGATRYLMNKAIEKVQNKEIKKPTSHITMRKAIMKTDKELKKEENKNERWLIEIPCDTRQLAFKQLASNYKTGLTQLKNKTISHFEMKFKTKKNPNQFFHVDSRALKFKDMIIFKRRCSDRFKLRKKRERWWKKNIICKTQNIIIKREKNRYFMCIPMKKEIKVNNDKKKYNYVSLDPGVRTFQTIYSEQNVVGKIGNNSCEELIDAGLKIDKLKSYLDKNKKEIKKRKKYNILKRCFLLRTKIRNKVSDLHWKTCNYLCSHFKNIFLPTFKVSKMIKKDLPHRSRIINSRSVRKMLSLSHGLFKERLFHMANKLNSKIHLCEEYWTSKSCGGCGLIDNTLKGKKTYICNDCGFKLDRDYNGARNIYMRQIQQMK